MATKLHALAAGCTAALLLLACDEKKPEPTPATTATAAASTAPAASAAPAVVSSAPAVASAPAAASSAEPADAAPGAFEMTLGDVKATKGKVEDGPKKFKLNMPRLQRKCVSPAVKKEPTAVGAGSIKLTLELDAEGKPKKVTQAAEGKFSPDLLKCITGYVEKEMEFGNDAKATLEATLNFAPKKP